MDYEKLHKDTIAKLQEMVNSGKITVEIARGICADFVPENEDERIRKAMIDFFKHEREEGITVLHYGVNIERIIAWLEKQGSDNHPRKEMVDIEKVCDFLKVNAIKYFNVNWILYEWYFERDQLIKDLHKAMEE